MIDHHNLQVFYTTRASDDMEGQLAFVHPDCVFRIVGTKALEPMTTHWTGLDQIRGAAQELYALWDMSRVETVSNHALGDTAFVHRKGDVVYRPDGSSLNTEFVDKLTFKDGLVIEYLQFVDTFAIANFMASKAAPDVPAWT